MQIYKKAYLKLFNAITDALEAIENGDSYKAIELLIRAQQDAEEIIISDQERASSKNAP